MGILDVMKAFNSVNWSSIVINTSTSYFLKNKVTSYFSDTELKYKGDEGANYCRALAGFLKDRKYICLYGTSYTLQSYAWLC